jgi:acyl carrier protein
MMQSQAPNHDELKASVRKYLADNLMLPGGLADLGDDASFLERNLLDSTGVLELVAFIEETYGVKVGDDEIIPDNLDSVTLVAQYVARKQAAAGKRPA